uniref:SAM domain-containing protein n=2 Tax=Graphocephala atropunctata TaxID=36148 RepID=A0A1B6K968_9HEMI
MPQSSGGQSHGIIMPQSSGGQSHGIIMPQSSGGQSHGLIMPQSSGGQSHGIIMPQSSGGQSHGIIVPQSTSNQSQVTNLIITSSSATNTPVAASLLIPGSNSSSSSLSSSHMTSLLIPQSPAPQCSAPVAGLVMPSTAGGAPPTSPKTSILVPVSVGPNSKSLLHPVTYSNGKKSIDASTITARDNKQSVLMKSPEGGNFPSLPPLQPISSNIGVNKSVLVKAPNGLSVPESLIMTPISDADVIKNKPDKISDEMTIERTPMVSVDDKGTSTIIMRMDDDGRAAEVGATSASARGTNRGEGLVMDGEVTVRRLVGPERTEDPEKRQMEDDVRIELVKRKHVEDDMRIELVKKKLVEDEVRIELVKPQKLPPPRYQKPEELNPMEVLEWDHQGVGKLPGSNIKFRINEYGLDLVVDNNKDESSSNTPSSSRRNSDDKAPNPVSDKTTKEIVGEATDKIYCCEGCGCYGLYTEFLMDTRFCSVGCKKIVLARTVGKKKRPDERLRELRLRRKRRKIKILSQRSKRGSVDQKIGKEQGDAKVSDSDDLRTASPTNSYSDASETVSRSLAGSNPSEDEGSSDRTAPSDVNKETWLNSSGEFMWSLYLQKCCKKAKAAPIRLFKSPFPDCKNGFKVGMKLEGIDPEHQAIISVLTVVQVRGYRIRLHFDGYPEYHDFWANADSPDIFPPGWCERNSHSLDPPRGYTMENFSWNMYLKQCRAQPAPKSLFPKSNTPLCPSQFRVGMKLEAVDRKNSSLVCVASVANLIDNRLLIHFDSWGDVYDYWTDPTSPYIHPVGWCEEYGHDLTPPNSYKNASQFSWELYLKETKSQAAPARAFKPRPPNTFKRGMKLEAVDKRAPSLLRPATVREVKDYQIKITFDGYPEEFGYWVDDDCPDIHPTGWGHKTGHPVTPPPVTSLKSECGTQDCTGDGNVKGGFLASHTTAALCPYAAQNLNKDSVPDRFCVNPDFYEVPEPIAKTKSTSSRQDTGEDSNSESRVKTRFSSGSVKEEIKEEPTVKIEPEEEKTEERIERRGRKRKLQEVESRTEQLDRLRKELIRTVLEPGYQPAPAQQEMWVKHVATLGHKVNVTGGDPRCWNHKQVAAFVNTVIPSRAKLFLDQEIDGEAFLMLTQCDLTKVLGLKLGPALKIYNCIILLRKKVMGS